MTPWTAARQAFLSITNSRSLLKLMSIELVMPSNHLILCCPFLLLPSILPTLRVLSNELVFHIRWPKLLEFQLQHQSFQRIFSPCRPRDSQESSLTPQFKSMNSLVLSFLYGPTLTSMISYYILNPKETEIKKKLLNSLCSLKPQKLSEKNKINGRDANWYRESKTLET